MIGFVNGENWATAKDIVRPNLLANSKHCQMGGIIPTNFGEFVNFDPSANGSIYLSDNIVNKGIRKDGTTYFALENNTYYVQTLWFTTSVSIKPVKFDEFFVVYSSAGASKKMSNVKVTKLGNNRYKVSGYFNSEAYADFDLVYIQNFGSCLGVTSKMQIRFDALKIEKGTESTDWCPAYDDYVMQSDLDDLKAEIEQLKSKS